MNVMRIILLLISLFFVKLIFTQEVYPDCTNPKIMLIPLQTSLNSLVEEELYYQPEDSYTYWYKLVVSDDCKLSYQMRPINEEDDYALIIFNFKGENFCNEVVKHNDQPFSNLSKGVLNVKQGEVYYFGVLHLNGNGCGHQLFIDTENKSALIKAIQHECVEEVFELFSMDKPVSNNNIEEEKKDTLIKVDTFLNQKPEVKSENKKVWMVFKNKENNQNLAASFQVKYNDTIQTLNAEEKGIELKNVQTKIAVYVEKFGYENFADTFPVKDTIVCWLSPVKKGEALVMYNIYFHPNTYALKDDAYKELEKLLNFMKENRQYNFEIQGHTNGNRFIKKNKKYEHLGEAWNFNGTAKKLSKMRAESIKNYLVKNGIDENRLTTIGYGGDRMIIEKPKTLEQALKNIRVEVHIVP